MCAPHAFVLKSCHRLLFLTWTKIAGKSIVVQKSEVVEYKPADGEVCCCACICFDTSLQAFAWPCSYEMPYQCYLDERLP